MARAHRLLGIERGDLRSLAALAPTFGLVAACTVMLASLSKALFLATNPIALLPWMFLGAAAITALSSLGYVALMRAMRLEARFRLLLGVAMASLVALRLGFPLAPASMGVVILLWCPAVGHLLVVQVWNVATTQLPTRQGKRMMPVLAAVTTMGAAIGGVLVQVLLRWLGAEDLLVVAAAALAFPLARLAGLLRALGAEDDAASRLSTPRPAQGESEIAAGFRSIVRRPILADLALLAFLLQAASLIIDYQFSAELKPRFDKDGIASFLGFFFWTSNLLVLALTLLATSRVIRAVGIGVALATSGIVIGLGSGLYLFAATTGALPMFWVVAATAFGERIASYAFAKPAVQMAYMPLQTSGGERAKTIIDGVIYRLATAVVSVLLLVAAPDLSTQFRLSLPATIACIVVVYLASRIGPHYRAALLEALRARRLDDHLLEYLRHGLGRGATRELARQLRSSSAERVLLALQIAQELAVDPDPELLDALVQHEDERVAQAALGLMEALGRRPSAEVLAAMLAPARPPKLLRGLLVLLTERATPELAEAVRPLTSHEDPGVASAACLFRIRAAGALASFDAEVEGRTAMVRLTGMTLAGDFARDLPGLLRHPDPQVRAEAIEHMGELRLALFLPPLLACLDVPDARRRSASALVSYGDRAVDAIEEHLGSEPPSLAGRVTALRALERIASAKADRALVKASGHVSSILRDHAVEALWRRAGSTSELRLDVDAIDELVDGEIERVGRARTIERWLAGTRGSDSAPRRAFFATEVEAWRIAAERRVFRLLGLRYDRAPLQRAFLHYRSAEARVRSNAIELLEQHLTEPGHRAFVAHVERHQEHDAEHPPPAADELEDLVGRDPWLRRLWVWAKDGQHEALSWDDRLDRLAIVRQMPLFESVTGEPLLPLSDALERIEVAGGRSIFAVGSEGDEVYFLLEGEVVLEVGERVRVPVRPFESCGEVAILDRRPRPCDARAVTEAVLARARGEDLDDAMVLFPAILRRLLTVLSARLRAVIA